MILSPVTSSQLIPVQGPPLMRSWFSFGGHIPTGFIPESVRHDSTFEISCREL